MRRSDLILCPFFFQKTVGLEKLLTVQGRSMRPPMGNLVLMDNGGMNTALMLECTLTEILNGLLVGKEHPLHRPAPHKGKAGWKEVQ